MLVFPVFVEAGICLFSCFFWVCVLKLLCEALRPCWDCRRTITHTANSIVSGSTAYRTPALPAVYNSVHYPPDSRPSHTPTLLWFSWFSTAQPTTTASAHECLLTTHNDTIFPTFYEITCLLFSLFAWLPYRLPYCLAARVSWHLSAFFSLSLSPSLTRSTCRQPGRFLHPLFASHASLPVCLSGFFSLPSCLLFCTQGLET